MTAPSGHTPHPEPEPKDLTDAEWTLVSPLLPVPKPGGRPRTIDLRAVVNAILHIQRAACPWRGLPRRYPNHSSVRTYYDRWVRDGTWDRVRAALGAPQ
ncbi:transposase [Frigoriglobus tundricola]|uniref:Insertion element IS402-like domain-containing protein n=1 Tax=Frigoriglobus tundricola TaxID=2774151 RepID=A0A6M5YNF2_9BACT|nr:transposase [Frigoriglobus tundricola]QJW94890.1 hypothetical protein FTUN_2416 [Frigoriglobus tundricola]